MKIIIDIPKDAYKDISKHTNCEWKSIIAIHNAIKNGIPLDDITTEIQQILDMDWSDGLYQALRIIDRHIGENTRHLKYAGDYADQDTMMPAT